MLEYSIGPQFGDKQVALIVADSNTIGVIQIVDNNVGTLRAGIKADDLPVPAMLHDIEQAASVGAAELFGTELGAGLRKIDDAVSRDREIIGKNERATIDLVDENLYRCIGVYSLQTQVSVGNNK